MENAVEAKKNKDASSLTSIAHDLKIDLSNIDYESIDALEDSILESEKEIDNIHNSYPWLWYYAPDNKKRPNHYILYTKQCVIVYMGPILNTILGAGIKLACNLINAWLEQKTRPDDACSQRRQNRNSIFK